MYCMYSFVALKHLGWECTDETAMATLTDHFIRLSILMFLSAVLYLHGNLKRTWSLVTALTSTGSMFAFGALGEWHVLKTSLTLDTEWPVMRIVIYALLGLCMVSLIAYHVFLAWCSKRPRIHREYTCALSAWILYIGLCYCMTVVMDPHGGYVFHAHHWMLAYCSSFFARFNTPLSQASMGMGVGVFVHGLAAYGMTPLLFLRTRCQIDFQRLLCDCSHV